MADVATTPTPAAAPATPGPIQAATMDMVRSVLMGLGTPLLAHGYVTGSQEQQIVGGLLAVGSAAWSYLASHPSKVSALAQVLRLVRAGGQSKAWDGDVARLKPLLVAIIKAEVAAQVKPRAGILAGPVDSVADAAIDAAATKAAAAVEA